MYSSWISNKWLELFTWSYRLVGQALQRQLPPPSCRFRFNLRTLNFPLRSSQRWCVVLLISHLYHRRWQSFGLNWHQKCSLRFVSANLNIAFPRAHTFPKSNGKSFTITCVLGHGRSYFRKERKVSSWRNSFLWSLIVYKQYTLYSN